MSFQSRYWKSIIKRYVKELENINFKSNSFDIFEKNISIFEIKLFSICYAIRKMADYHKIPSDIIAGKVNIKIYNRKRQHERFYIDLEKDFNLEKFILGEITIRELCNQFIHSKVFEYRFYYRGYKIKEILFASDKVFKNKLYSINLKDLLKLFLYIINKDVKSIIHKYEENTKKEVIESFSV